MPRQLIVTVMTALFIQHTICFNIRYGIHYNLFNLHYGIEYMNRPKILNDCCMPNINIIYHIDSMLVFLYNFRSLL